jgi:hypothetical protein
MASMALRRSRGIGPARRLGVALILAGVSFAALALTALALPTLAAAAPSVLVKGRAVPIPGFRDTGNILGAGAAVEAEVKISGTEYGGFPAPLIGITVYLPMGVKIDTRDFPTCPTRVIAEEREPRKCPKGSAAGPIGKVEGVVAFGQERVEETAEIHSFFAPGGGLEFLVDGHSPVSLEIPTSSRLLQPGGGGGFGPEFTGPIPLVETVPGAPDASTEKIDITLGSAIRKHGKAYYYGRVPKTCPAGGFRVKALLTFAENAQLSEPVTVTVPFRVPCPPR